MGASEERSEGIMCKRKRYFLIARSVQFAVSSFALQIAAFFVRFRVRLLHTRACQVPEELNPFARSRISSANISNSYPHYRTPINYVLLGKFADSAVYRFNGDIYLTREQLPTLDAITFFDVITVGVVL